MSITFLPRSHPCQYSGHIQKTFYRIYKKKTWVKRWWQTHLTFSFSEIQINHIRRQSSWWMQWVSLFRLLQLRSLLFLFPYISTQVYISRIQVKSRLHHIYSPHLYTDRHKAILPRPTVPKFQESEKYTMFTHVTDSFIFNQHHKASIHPIKN